MEFTNLIFAMLLVFAMVAGMSVFLVDVQANYPDSNLAANGTASGLYSATAQLNASLSDLAPSLNQSAYNSVNTNTQESGIAAALGYLFGAISSLQVLLSIPSITLNFVSVLAAMGGIFVPVYVIGVMTLAVIAIMLIGLLYYLMKVH